MTSTTFNQELVYLIRDDASGLHKIGITTNWDRRSRELGVGLVPCDNSKYWEKVLHRYFKDRRLPQSEWFRVTEEEALPMMPLQK